MDRLRAALPRIVIVLLFVAVLGGIMWRNYRISHPPLPPMPPNALNQTVSWPTTNDSQFLTYETDLALPALITFYQTALAPTGWVHRCTSPASTPECRYEGVPTEHVVVFIRGTPGTATWQTLRLQTAASPDPARLRVNIVQRFGEPHWNDALPTVVPASPLVGEWIGRPGGPDAPLVVFWEDGRISLNGTVRGTYQATADAVHMRLTSAGGYGVPALCQVVPAFLQPWCQETPTPTPGLLMTYPTAMPSTAERYPLPTVPSSPAQGIDVRFTMTVTAMELHLTDAAGRRTSFQRVVAGQ